MPTKAVSVGTSVVLMVDEARNRTAIMIANPDSTALLYISDELEKCKTTEGMPIFPQTYILLSAYEGVDTEKKLWVISDTAAKNARVMEFYGKWVEYIVAPPTGKGDPLASWQFGKVMKK